MKPQWLSGNVTLAPTLRKETKRLLDGGVGALPKVLVAYMRRLCCLLTQPAVKQHSLHEHWANMRA